jgi:hypothetical protein
MKAVRLDLQASGACLPSCASGCCVFRDESCASGLQVPELCLLWLLRLQLPELCVSRAFYRQRTREWIAMEPSYSESLSDRETYLDAGTRSLSRKIVAGRTSHQNIRCRRAGLREYARTSRRVRTDVRTPELVLQNTLVNKISRLLYLQFAWLLWTCQCYLLGRDH